ncbi:MAG: hypothetical protein L3J92_01430 [Thermoplasmata archaeon]|nr:hypothetical protein [Thermoplasmata archaeon]
MTREKTFWIGGALTIGLGLAFAVGLVWAGAGVEFSSSYLAVAFALVLGSFFLYVAGAEARERASSQARSGRDAREDLPDGRTRPP